MAHAADELAGASAQRPSVSTLHGEGDVLRDKLIGCLLGTACGDACGLRFEGLDPATIERALAERPLAPRFFLGRGLVSDDTELAAAVVEALCVSREPEAFARAFAWRMRLWFVALPPALGLATARACLRLCLGAGPTRAGIRSAGNGAAMRVAALGVVARDEDHADALATACARVTHTDPRAVEGARFVACWAHRLARGDAGSVAELVERFTDEVMRERSAAALALAQAGATPAALRERLTCPKGPSGFIVETIPAVIYCLTRHADDPRAAVEAAARLGGDTDTIAAIVGGLAGARHGASAWPRAWLDRIVDWPWRPSTLTALAVRLADGQRPPPFARRWPLALARNAVFLALAVAVVLRRWIDAIASRVRATR
ncbi:MAG: ADP-ribosylglycohydrolase family protein [Nannocystaceae bacterium]